VTSSPPEPPLTDALDALVVEDDAYIRATVAACLEDEGYRVATAPHGRAALDLLERRREGGGGPPWIILLDMRMPVMDGWSFADAYRQTPGPHAQIVVITAAHDADERASAVAARAVLPKPFDVDELLDTVRRCAADREGTDRAAPSG
jgi:two-component system chemotaxis response regulator CheY